MKKLMIMSFMLVGQFSLAGTGQGSVSCNASDRVVALYSWFHSQADSYSSVTVFVQETDGSFKQYVANNDVALNTLSIKTNAGSTITVTPNLRNRTCSIQEN